MDSSRPTPSSAPPTAAQKKLSAQRAEAARARIAASQRRRRLWTVVASLGTIVVLVLALIVVKVATNAGAPQSGARARAASQSVATAIGTVPGTAFDAAGAGSGKALEALTGAPLTADGKPRVLFIGGEFCPYCAAERWPLAVALSRFGILHRLGQTSSSPTDVYPSTPTLSFHGTTYTSRYLSFTGEEAQSNKVAGNTYAPLDPIDPADQALWKQIGGNGYPFLDIGGRWVSLQAAYSPQLLHGMTQRQVAGTLSDTGSNVGQTILGAANQLTAAICTATRDSPAAVCKSAGVTAATGKLSNGG
ncbi:MAG TPA: DUF929 family protein [Jatrophihabitans sp.]|jgi:hypothetical protein